MFQKNDTLRFFIVVSLVSTLGVEGVVLTKGEDVELERQLKLLNKPAIKTIQTEDGDVFDCVDIYKQPAFDHPSLKNHKIQMMPGYFPEALISKTSSQNTNMKIEPPKISCPHGSIPIRRVRKEDLIRIKSHPNVKEKHTSSVGRYHYWAVMKSKEGEYYGTQAYLNVYGVPQIKLEQSTSSEIIVMNGVSGPMDHFNTVQAGWTIKPELFNNTGTHLFTYWTADGYNSTGCYNLLCPGFVQVSKDIPIGLHIKPLSTYKGQQYMLKLTIYKDPLNKQWWLLWDNKTVGYWPITLFNSLADRASAIYWGGSASTPSNLPSPPMGSGHFPKEGFRKACHVRNIQIVDSNNTLYNPNKDDQYPYATKPECYDVGGTKYVNDNFGYTFYFGGPEGCSSM